MLFQNTSWDVVAMTSSQLILGRLWIYDKGGMHRMGEDVYAFIRHGLHITLQSNKKRTSIPKRSSLVEQANSTRLN